MASDWRTAGLTAPDMALCTFAERLTNDPAQMRAGHLATLRAHGFDDVAIHDATQVVSYFNYINRVADGLGVDPESVVRHWEQAPRGEGFGEP